MSQSNLLAAEVVNLKGSGIHSESNPLAGQESMPPEAMNGESIVYMAKEWGQETTSCDFVFEQLARHNRVMWVNSIATRTPRLTSARDWKKIFSKLKLCFGGLRQVGSNAWLYQPVFVPLPFSKLAQRANRWLLCWALRRQLRKLGMRRPQLWFFQPNGAFLIGQLNESVVVYYCVDEWTHFAHLEREKVEALEMELLQKADVCFATSEPLATSKKRFNPNTFLALHGVDYERFAQALDPAMEIPADVARLPQPVIGFFGGIRAHVDQELIVRVADRHPEWSLVLVGSAYVDVSVLRNRPNIHLLGHRRNQDLPAYCKAFSVGIIPYRQTEFIRHVNPIKLRQYLSAGLPVVSTFMYEAQRHSNLVTVAQNHDEFLAGIEREIQGDNPQKRQERSRAMQGETWDAKVAALSQTILRAKAGRDLREPRHVGVRFEGPGAL